MLVDLIYPPLTDPTVSYHSLFHLSAHLRKASGHWARVRDLNTVTVSRALEQDFVTACQDNARARLQRLDTHQSQTGTATSYVDLMRILAFDPSRVSDAAGLMRDADRFFRHAPYSDAAWTIVHWIEAVSALGVPGAFTGGFDVMPVPGYDPDDLSTLLESDYLDLLIAPFRPALEAEVARLTGPDRASMIGLGVTYRSQLPFALWIARKIRQACPDIPLIAGGTEISTVWKCTFGDDFRRVTANFDAVVLGDGESAIVALANHFDPERSGGDLTSNTILVRHTDGNIEFSPKVEPLRLATRADYSGLEDAHILAPQAVAYYSPSRGCYWNKCTFCDYGTNFDRPTAPWRQKPVPETVAELKALSQVTDLVYFSVDVLAPGWLMRLAKALVEENVRISWSAELRVEARFDAEVCALLKRSGCVALSFGFESASPRILDVIDKGTNPVAMRETLINVAEAGIAVQVMGFVGFPTETAQEAMVTIDYLEDLRSHWSVAAIGTFHLTPGAIVAKQPEAFGITRVAPMKPGRINRMLDFDAPGSSEAERKNIEDAKNRLSTTVFDRPFAGGVDCVHTLLYYRALGPDFVGIMRQDHFETVGPPSDFAARAVLMSEIPRRVVETAAKERRQIIPSFDEQTSDAPEDRALEVLVAESGLIMPAAQEICTIIKTVSPSKVRTTGSLGWEKASDAYVASLLRRKGIIRRVSSSITSA